MSASFIIASNGKRYSLRKLSHIASGIISKREPIGIFMPIFRKIITNQLSIVTAARFMQTVHKQDLRKKIFIDPNGYILGGELALVKALFSNKVKVRVIQFASWEEISSALALERNHPATIVAHQVSSSTTKTRKDAQLCSPVC